MIDSLLAGGAERVAVELACGLNRERFTPHVLVTRNSGPLIELLERADVPVTFLNRKRKLDLLAWRKAHQHLAENADLLHTHKFASNAWGALLSRTSGVPLIAHEHNFSEQASKVKGLISKRLIAKHAQHIICVSQSVADTEQQSGTPSSLLEVIPNGVHLNAAINRSEARAELGLSDTAFVVGIVGRLRPEKAHEVLLNATALAKESGVDITLCIVGDGPQKNDLEALTNQLGISDSTIWAGERRDAARLASAFDTAVICSHWEGLPLAALEAMAAKVPLIATKVGGLVDLLEGDAGLLVPPANPKALSEALTTIYTNPNLRQNLAITGYNKVQKGFSFGGMVKHIEYLYEKTLANDTPVATYTPKRGYAA